MKTTYYLFGEDACKIYNESIDEVHTIDNVINSKCTFDTYRFGSLDGDDNPTDLLLAFTGWGDFVEITKKEHLRLLKHQTGKEQEENFTSSVELLGVTIEVFGEIEDEGLINLGGMTISREDREYMVDTAQFTTTFANGMTTIEASLVIYEGDEEDVFEGCPYDITRNDLMADDIKATLYIEQEFDNEIESITLFVKFLGEHGGMTKAINVTQE